MAPFVGLRFRHARILNQNNAPAIYIVTAIRKGVIYYKQPDERKAKEYCTLDRWPFICGSAA